MAEAFVKAIIDGFNSLIQEEIGLLWGFNKEMENFSSTLSTICAVLEDAEEKQFRDKAIKNWLQKLKDVSYELKDILDDCEMEASGSDYRGQSSRLTPKVRASFRSCLHIPTNMLFRHKIANRMKEVTKNLNEIANERVKFHLRETVEERQTQVRERRETSSIITQPLVYGREEDKEKIVEFLVGNASNCENVSVYPIVGMGGLGKTTLAQLVFNEKKVMGNFELKIWVCVSEDFDVKRLVKAIIEAASGSSCDILGMDPLQKRLQEVLRRKRYLLVLDDVWNEDQEEWEKLKYVLDCGSNGSSIIVTTRLKKVASVMGTIPMHELCSLSEDDCWLLFKQRAFGNEREERPNLVKIGKEIVRKCSGVPLAAKALGSLMRFKCEENEWLSVMKSELWNLPQDENSILPALRLSYFHLPVELRRCFAYCAIFPKDSLLDKTTVIELWMANDFLSSKGQLEKEEMGNEICNELYWRSFFQEAGKDKYDSILRFKMHDLVHDLAQSVMEDECRIMDTLRTFMVSDHLPNTNIFKNPCRLNFQSTRAFSAPCELMSISPIVKSSKHLKYLDLSISHTIKILPESICFLHNLQTLNLNYCHRLEKLPKNLSRLRSLRHLHLEGCHKLTRMPPHIGRLTCLRMLTFFIVDSRRGCHLDELQGLNLGEKLTIRHLEKVGSPLDAERANLSGKMNLKGLHLCWSGNEPESLENLEQVLEALEPPESLTVLQISCYKGRSFPYWMSNISMLENLVCITLFDCKNSLQLPPLGRLPLLRDLSIIGIDSVKYVDNESYDGKLVVGFMRLESLCICSLPNLERLSMVERKEMFPCLSRLHVRNCLKLSLSDIPSIKQLEVTVCAEVLLKSVSILHGLTSLFVAENDEMTSLPDGMLQSLSALQSLCVKRFTKLRELPADMLIRLSCLETLHVESCYELECFSEGIMQGPSYLRTIKLCNCMKFESFPGSFRYLTALQTLELGGCFSTLEPFPHDLVDLIHLSNFFLLFSNSKTFPKDPPDEFISLPQGIQHLPSLKCLVIDTFPDLTSLPNWLGNLTSLQELEIKFCPNLTSLPASIRNLTNLQKLTIFDNRFSKLAKRCVKETDEDWHKIAHIPEVQCEFI
ncbi:hypothetical protein FNV43_RR09588 [Rhamnella rubrinervis]|uniref:Disease resistance protein RGA3 n=1 Tax=Rhamnella rubrinervis TaxID=2594499 RepID=A0A8K0HAC8_9ROSA|nr:hypothetical protein FNV43_RR09588 [Rhamnella rubrinervis]